MTLHHGTTWRLASALLKLGLVNLRTGRRSTRRTKELLLLFGSVHRFLLELHRVRRWSSGLRTVCVELMLRRRCRTLTTSRKLVHEILHRLALRVCGRRSPRFFMLYRLLWHWLLLDRRSTCRGKSIKGRHEFEHRFSAW